MAESCYRPAIMPISNPTKLCEAKAEDIINWSNGKALVVKQAIEDGVCRADHKSNDAETLVNNEIWIPQYR